MFIDTRRWFGYLYTAKHRGMNAINLSAKRQTFMMHIGEDKVQSPVSRPRSVRSTSIGSLEDARLSTLSKE